MMIRVFRRVFGASRLEAQYWISTQGNRRRGGGERGLNDYLKGPAHSENYIFARLVALA